MDITLIAISLVVGLAYGAPGDLCWEQGDIITRCNFLDAPLEALVQPYEAVFDVWWVVIVWGMFLGILWLKTQNTMLVGIVGLMASSLIGGVYEPALGIGVVMFLIAMGFTFYGLIQYRLEQPQQ